MKRYILMVFIAGCLFCHDTHPTDNFAITLKSKWKNLDNDTARVVNFGGKWILVGSITFKKKSKDPITLKNLCLHWHGKTVQNLAASLYIKNVSKDFLPIEKNLICDGMWNKTKQTIVFNFEEKETLTPTTTFYLVLTVPEMLEEILTDGYFSIEEHSIPKPFKHCCQSVKLNLANNTRSLSGQTAS